MCNALISGVLLNSICCPARCFQSVIGVATDNKLNIRFLDSSPAVTGKISFSIDRGLGASSSIYPIISGSSILNHPTLNIYSIRDLLPTSDQIILPFLSYI